jgi:hypothetical protein
LKPNLYAAFRDKYCCSHVNAVVNSSNHCEPKPMPLALSNEVANMLPPYKAHQSIAILAATKWQAYLEYTAVMKQDFNSRLVKLWLCRKSNMKALSDYHRSIALPNYESTCQCNISLSKLPRKLFPWMGSSPVVRARGRSNMTFWYQWHNLKLTIIH